MTVFGKKLDRHFCVGFNRRAGEFVFLSLLFALGYFALIVF